MGVGDESFKKPGSVPFKWEEKPGVPKSHHDHNHHPLTSDHHRSLPTTPRKLAPPPSSIYTTTPPPDLGSQSFRTTTSGSQSGRHRLDPKPRTGPSLARPLVVSAGCLLSPLFKWGRKKKVAHKASPEHEPDCVVSVPESSKAGSLPRRSRWTRKSMSSWEFPSSSFLSRRSSSSPRAVRDPEWAGFGLF